MNSRATILLSALTLAILSSTLIVAPASAATTVTVSTSTQLSSALKAAKPGTTIQLRDGVYKGKFASSASGTALAPITLTGSRAAILSSGSRLSGRGLHLTGSRWVLQGFSVSTSEKGIMLDNSDYTVIDDVEVRRTGHEGIHVRKGSSYVTVKNSYVHDTGMETPGFGEGIYVGSAQSNWDTVMGSSKIADASNRVQIISNRIANTAAEGIDIKEGTANGVISSNSFTNSGFSGSNSGDSWIDVKGNAYVVSGNSGSTAKTDAFQVHSVRTGWGKFSVFANNTVVAGVPGYEVNVAASTTLSTVIGCESSGAKKGLTNIACG